VPLLVRYPALNPREKRVAEAVSLADVYPTILDGLHMEIPPGLAGRSLLPCWQTASLGYLNGSSHWSAALTSFAGTQTRSQLDFVASFQPRHSLAVLARGVLGMLRYDASKILSQIRIPALVLCVDQDAVTLPEASEHIDQEAPAASLHWSPGNTARTLSTIRLSPADSLSFARSRRLPSRRENPQRNHGGSTAMQEPVEGRLHRPID